MNIRVEPQRRGDESASQSPSFSPSRTENIAKLVGLVAYAAYMLWMVFGLLLQLLSVFSSRVTIDVPVGLAVDFWGTVAGLALAFAILNLRDWSNGKRFALGMASAAVMLGSLGVGGVGHMLASLTGGSLGAVSPLSSGFLIALAGGLLLAPWVMLFGGAFVMLLVLGAVFGAVGFFLVVPMMLFRQILEFDNALAIYRYQSRGLVRYVVRFIYWLRNQPLPKGLPDDSRGARFAEPEEIAALNCPQGMGFGHVDGQLLRIDTDKHVLIMASTRSGKGTSLIIPHLLRHPGSAFVLDPKGENAKATGRRRAQLNNKVLYLDPFGISGKPKARFNPLSRLTPANMEAESKALAAALFVPGEGEKRDHWFEAGQQLIALLIMYVFTARDIPPARKDLTTVRQRLLGDLTPTLEAMLEMDDADGLLRDLALSFLTTPEKERGSIASVAQRQTAVLDNPALKACLAASGPGEEVDFKDWRRGTMTVYLCLSAPKFPVFNRWLRLVLTSALDEMTDTLDPPPVPVCFMLDELATLGHLHPIENAIGLAAGYGVQLVCVFQDVAQMRDLYKGRWASFIGNAGVRALFSLDDFDTAKYWSNFIGGQLMETHSHQEDLYGLSSGQNVGEAVRPLLSPESLMLQFNKERMLVLAQGAHPVIAERKTYWNDRSLDGLWDDPRSPREGGGARTFHGGPGTPPPPSSGGPTSPPIPPKPSSGPKAPPQSPKPSPSSSAPKQQAWPGGYNTKPTASFGGANIDAGAAKANQGAQQPERTIVRTKESAGYTFRVYSDETVEIISPNGEVSWSTVANLSQGQS
jgi:type IV secretion system protein VirD4